MIKHLTFFHIEVLSNLSCKKKNKLIISDRKSIFTRIKFSNPSQLFHSLVKQNANIFSRNRIKYNVKIITDRLFMLLLPARLFINAWNMYIATKVIWTLLEENSCFVSTIQLIKLYTEYQKKLVKTSPSIPA